MSRPPSSPLDGITSEPGDFRACLTSLAYSRTSISRVFADFCRITACGLAMRTREDEYLEAIKGYSKHDLDQLAKAMALLVNEMESKPFEDVLGVLYTEHVAGPDRQRRGEFYTPPNVLMMMAKMNIDPDAIRAAGHPITVSDPCCGSGGMALVCAELMIPDIDLLRVMLQDVTQSPLLCRNPLISRSPSREFHSAICSGSPVSGFAGHVFSGRSLDFEGFLQSKSPPIWPTSARRSGASRPKSSAATRSQTNGSHARPTSTGTVLGKINDDMECECWASSEKHPSPGPRKPRKAVTPSRRMFL